MARTLERLTVDHLGDLPEHCRTCTFWQFDPVRRARIRGHEEEEKAAWVSGVLRDWGPVGRVLRVDDELVGHLLWAPASYLPGGDGFATAPVSPDAVLLATGYVEPEHRDQGLARVLVQAMARDLVRRGGVGAIEAFGANRPGNRCVLPVDFLLAVGFRTHRPHPAYPRMRMDLGTTLSWREELEAALDRILGVVGGRRAPRPSTPPVSRGSSLSPRRGSRERPGRPSAAR